MLLVLGKGESMLLVLGKGESMLLVLGKGESMLLVLGKGESMLLVLGKVESMLLVLGKGESMLLVLGKGESIPLILGKSESMLLVVFFIEQTFDQHKIIWIEYADVLPLLSGTMGCWHDAQICLDKGRTAIKTWLWKQTEFIPAYYFNSSGLWVYLLVIFISHPCSPQPKWFCLFVLLLLLLLLSHFPRGEMGFWSCTI